MVMAPTEDNPPPIDYLRKLEGIHAFITEILNVGSMVAPTPEITSMRTDLKKLGPLLEKAINNIADNDYTVPPNIAKNFNKFKHHILKIFHKHNLIDSWNNSEHSGWSELQEEYKSESWWNTLKEGGTMMSGKAGITNMAYGKGAQKPKKLKKPKEEEEYPIIPEDPDFWRD